MLVVIDELFGAHLLANDTLAVHLQDTLNSKVWADGISTVSNQDTHVVDLTGLTSLDNKGSVGSPLVADEMVVNHTSSQASGYGNAVNRRSAVGQDKDVVAGLDALGSSLADSVESVHVTIESLALGECDVDGLDGPVRVQSVRVGQRLELFKGQDGRWKK